MRTLIIAAILALLALLAPLAHAADPPPCWASNLVEGGTGTPYRTVATDEGQAWGWWCVVDGKPWPVVVAWMSWGDKIKFPAAPCSTSTSKCLAALWAANMTDTGPDHAAIIAAINAAIAGDKPTVSAYIVAPSVSGYRPTYTAVSGVLTPTGSQIATATAGKPTPCDCAAGSLLRSTSLYCRVQPAAYALCKAR